MRYSEKENFTQLKDRIIKRVKFVESGKVILITDFEIFIIDYSRDEGLTCEVLK